MTKDQAEWFRRAAQSLSRAGLLWLALTAVALGSLVSAGAGLAPSARLVAASTVGTGKLKANGPGAPTVIPGHLSSRAMGPDADAKRVHAGDTPVGLIPTAYALPGLADAERITLPSDADKPSFRPRAFDARAPPRIA
jgi:hypothetical protein